MGMGEVSEMTINKDMLLRINVSNIRIESRKKVSVEFELHALNREGEDERLQERSSDTLVGRMEVPLSEEQLVWDSPSSSLGADYVLDSCVERAFDTLSKQLTDMLGSRQKKFGLL